MHQIISNLIGGKLVNINRICDLTSIDIMLENGEFVFLHTQCFFRFIMKDKVLASSEDFYKCDKDYDDKNFEWDKPGKSLFDVSIKRLSNILFTPRILSAQKSTNGDLFIAFDNGLLFQVFIDTVENEEKYRLIKGDMHYIVCSSPQGTIQET